MIKNYLHTRALLNFLLFHFVLNNIMFIAWRFHSVSRIDSYRNNIETTETKTWCVTVHYEGDGMVKIVNFCVTYFLNGPKRVH